MMLSHAQERRDGSNTIAQIRITEPHTWEQTLPDAASICTTRRSGPSGRTRNTTMCWRWPRGFPPRARVAEDLDHRGLVHDRVLACATRLLDLGFFRIGSDQYARTNGTYGLTTMLCRHVTCRAGGTITFDYPAKGRTAVHARP
jgi:hypothetical protein